MMSIFNQIFGGVILQKVRRTWYENKRTGESI